MEEKEFKRSCPICNKELTYKYKQDFIKASKKNSNCKSCATSLSGNKFKEGHNLNDNRIRKNSLDKLINDECAQSFYWIGFLLADGSFHSKTKFEFGLAEKDKNALDSFAKYINLNGEVAYREETNSYRISFSNNKSIPAFMQKYGFKFKKTYNPIDFDVLKVYSKDLLTSLLIGIIDGDGHIANNGSSGAFVINITAHQIWREFYKKLLEHLSIQNTINEVSDTNTIRISIYQKEYITKLNQFINNNNIFHLERKWKIII